MRAQILEDLREALDAKRAKEAAAKAKEEGKNLNSAEVEV